MSSDVAVRKLTTEQLQALNSFDDALELFSDTGFINASDIGDGFRMVDKKELIGREMLVLSYTVGKGDYQRDGKDTTFVVVRAVARKGDTGGMDKVIFTDGGTGVCSELLSLMERGYAPGAKLGLLCPKGLQRSDYKYTDPVTGNQSPASTYYLDTAPVD